MRALAILFAFALAGASARANDSTAELGVGGLVLTRTADVEMLSEDLYVSLDEVRVRYRFRNRTRADVATVVAFPIPPMEGGEEFFYYTLPVEDPKNFLGFSVSVDGRPVTPAVEQRALAADLDRTDLLTSLGVPVSLVGEAARKALDALPAARKAELVRLGLAYPEEDFATKTTRMVPAWSMKTTFWWEQTFPAGRDTVVEHRYRPIVGQTAGLGFDPRKPAGAKDRVERHCMDKAFLDAVAKLDADARRRNGAAVESRVSYVLTTGANWAGPIGDFRLVVDKGRPDRLVSFCGEGVRRISPTQFEMRKKYFTPTRDLHVVVVETSLPSR